MAEKETKSEIKPIVRIAEVDLNGHKNIKSSLPAIKGVGYNLAMAIARKMNLDPNMKLGELSDSQIEELEKIIKDPVKAGLPSFLVNRRADPTTGEDLHIVSSKLIITKKMDIDLLRKIRAYRGIRHELGLPVRGQRTRGSFRKGRVVGVTKKKKK